jgi:hypothetical protein
MIVRYFHIMRVAAFPAKTQAPLIINANAPLPLSVSRQSFQSVAGRNAQVIDYLCRIDRLKLAPGHVLHMRGNGSDPVAIEYRRGELVGERADHALILMLCISNVKRYGWSNTGRRSYQIQCMRTHQAANSAGLILRRDPRLHYTPIPDHSSP